MSGNYFNFEAEIVYPKSNGTMTLYHGSPEGLDGPIRVDAQKEGKYYDFGRGFYTAVKSEAARHVLSQLRPEDYDSLSENYVDPYLYTLTVDLDGCSVANISGKAWTLFVAYNRGVIQRDMCPEFCDSIDSFIENHDVLTGYISDDKTAFSLQLFAGNLMGFESFHKIMEYINPHIQYVFRSQNAADKINIVDIARFDVDTCRKMSEKSWEEAAKMKRNVNKFYKRERKNGLYLFDLIDKINEEKIIFPDKNKNIQTFFPK